MPLVSKESIIVSNQNHGHMERDLKEDMAVYSR
mgnify:CR=1 FL=1